VVFGLTLAVALFVATGTPQVRAKESPTCLGIEASLRVSPTVVKVGSVPAFTLVLRNGSQRPVRLLDVRAGRRTDLAHNYYELVLQQNGQTLKNLLRAIADPGPIDTADYFVLSPASAVEIPLTTSADLSSLRIGQYAAHVRITLDPLSPAAQSCQSTRTSFSVVK
jgi:hypothetical protein